LTESISFSIETKDLTYTYPNTEQATISKVNLKIEAGEKVVLQGENGSGKTTLLRLLARLFEPTSGTLYINNTNSKLFSLEEYRSKIGFIALNESPFDGTIYENITNNNPNITLEQVHAVLEKVKLTENIKNLPKGLDTHLFPQGKQINSSVIQKIMVARCIINNPQLLFLEEPIDKTDEKTAKEIIDILTSPENTWTLVVIAKHPYWKEKCTKTISLG